MVWLQPVALFGLAAIAGPLVIHLLRRRRARRVIVPTVRFVAPRDLSSVRLRTPADPWLLLVRVGILACAAAALAAPLLLTGSRAAAWDARVARALVVDTSESARAGVAAGALDAERSSVAASVVIETPELRSGIRRAVAWLSETVPSRREIVILSDFQAGAMTFADLASVPASMGIRLVPSREPTVAAVPPVGVLTRDGLLRRHVQADDDRTSAVFGGTTDRIAGLSIETRPEESDAAAFLWRVVSRAGAVAPSPEQPIVVGFRMSKDAGASTQAVSWALAAGQRLLRMPELAGVPLRLSVDSGALIIDADLDPRSLDAAQVVHAALQARVDPSALSEHEPLPIRGDQLAAWSRPAPPPDADAWTRSDESDARWLWGCVLVLLGVESWIRRSTAGTIATEANARAA